MVCAQRISDSQSPNLTIGSPRKEVGNAESPDFTGFGRLLGTMTRAADDEVIVGTVSPMDRRQSIGEGKRVAHCLDRLATLNRALTESGKAGGLTAGWVADEAPGAGVAR